MKLILLLSLSVAVVSGAQSTVCDFSEDVCQTASGVACDRSYQQFFNFSSARSYPTYYYDVLSYGGIYLTGTGNIAGRAATGRDFNATSGSTVGLQIRASDGYATYSLVAQDAVNWPKGSLGPSDEGIFAGSSFSGSSALRRRVTGDCGDETDCQFLLWNNIYRYWNTWSGYAYSLQPTTTWNFNRYGRMWIECPSATQKINVIYANISDWNRVRSFHIDNTCNKSAIWLFNIGLNNNDVTTFFDQVEPFPVEYSTGHVIYNVHALTKVVTTIRDVKISAAVNGNIVGINNNVIQVDGKVNGRIITLDAKQLTDVGRPHCPNTNVL